MTEIIHSLVCTQALKRLKKLGTRGEGREPGYKVPGRGENLGTKGENLGTRYKAKCLNLHYQGNKLNHTEEYRQCTNLPLQNEKRVLIRASFRNFQRGAKWKWGAKLCPGLGGLVASYS